jgi:CRISPR-associated endonuclease/helicase Cas3
MLEGAEALRGKAHDWDLVLHLVASHHGHCRPLAPVAFDPAPESVTFEHDRVRVSASTDHGLERLDSGVGARFWRLVRRYGWWGLAYLEAILRLGDHRRSEHEQRGGNP